VELIDDDHEEHEEDEYKIKSENTQDELQQYTREKIPRWQRNLQTFYNPLGREDDNIDNTEYGEIAFLSMLEGSMDEPRFFNEAWNHSDNNERESWRQAIEKELLDMEKKKVWEIIDKSSVPKERSLIGNKWVFKQKKNGVYRARLVALGYSQVPGVDFSENYAPVVNDITTRIMLVLKMVNNWTSETIDVETAFLYGDLTEEIYMTIPKGLEEFTNRQLTDKCVKLNKSIYGLVQAARAWWKQFTTSLQKIGFSKCLNDNCLMMKTDKKGVTILCIYVDDVCLFGNQEAIETTIKQIETIYSIKRVGPLTEFIGVNMEMKGDDLYLGQTDTLKRLEDKFKGDIERMKAYETPAGANETINRPDKNDELLEKAKQDKYRSGVGIILWLMKHSRPDISNAIREASKVMDGATKQHWKYLLRVIKYVIETKQKKLRYTLKKEKMKKIVIQGFCDSDYAGDRETRKSVAGYVIYILGCMVAWKSKSQKSVALSSSEAEYISISEITKDILFVKQILEFLKQEIEYPINIKVDNIGAIYMAENNMSNNQTKHVNTRYHFVRELIEDGTIKVEFVRSENNDSDIFTKNVGKELYLKHSNKFMSTYEMERETDNARRTVQDEYETDDEELIKSESGIMTKKLSDGECEKNGIFG
jgi:Reverse transcriptase (RNA-dependent DNA polymerase)